MKQLNPQGITASKLAASVVQDGDKNVWTILAAADCVPGVDHILYSEPEEHFSTKVL